MNLLIVKITEFFTNQPDIAQLFIALIGICAIFSIFVSLFRSYIFHQWKNKFDYFIAGSDSLTEEEKEAFNQRLEISPFKDIVNSIRNLLKDSKEMSVSDINLLIEERLLRYENSIRSAVTMILSIGLFFTLFGVFLALNDAFATADNMRESGNARNIDLNKLMNNFSIAFISTFIAFLTSIIINFIFLQSILTKFREKFQRSLVLYAKNIMIPMYAIEEVDKNLGKLVRSINQSAESFKTAGESLRVLANKNKDDSHNVLEAIEGLNRIFEKTKERDESLIKGLESITDRINSLTKKTEDSKLPYEQLRQDLSSWQSKIGPEMELLTQSKRLLLDSSEEFKTNLDNISKNNEKLANFFNTEFKIEVDKVVTDKLNKYAGNFTQISKQIEDMQKDINVNQDLRNSIEKLEGKVNQDLDKTNQHINDLIEGNRDVKDNTINIQNLIDKRLNFKSEFEKSLEGFKEEINGVISKQDFPSKEEINDINKRLAELYKLIKTNTIDIKDEVSKIESKIKKLSGKGGLFSRLWGNE